MNYLVMFLPVGLVSSLVCFVIGNDELLQVQAVSLFLSFLIKFRSFAMVLEPLCTNSVTRSRKSIIIKGKAC